MGLAVRIASVFEAPIKLYNTTVEYKGHTYTEQIIGNDREQVLASVDGVGVLSVAIEEI